MTRQPLRKRAYIGTLVIGVLVGIAGLAQAADDELWYRGYFDGAVSMERGPNPGYYYRPSRPTTYPLNEWLYSDPIPCDHCGRYHQQGAYVPELGKVCKGKGTHYDPDLVYTRAPYMLPGQYWHEQQNHYGFRTPITVGWPYMKYDQRREATGSIPMGRTGVRNRGR